MIGICAGEPRAGDDLEPDPTAADHRHGVAGLHAGDVADGADTRDHAAAEQRRLPQRKLARDRDRAARRDDGVLGEAGRPEAVLEHRPVREVQPARPVHQHPPRAVLTDDDAEVRLAGEAEAAGAAGRDEAERDMIPGRDVRHPLADRLDDTRTLVAHDGRPEPVAQLAVGMTHVRVADARGRDLDQHLPRLRRVELDRARWRRARPDDAGLRR